MHILKLNFTKASVSSHCNSKELHERLIAQLVGRHGDLQYRGARIGRVNTSQDRIGRPSCGYDCIGGIGAGPNYTDKRWRF